MGLGSGRGMGYGPGYYPAGYAPGYYPAGYGPDVPEEEILRQNADALRDQLRTIEARLDELEARDGKEADDES